MSSASRSLPDGGFLEGIRVLEIADEQGEYCGKLLAGLGADVVKVEPPEGEVTRRYGPFYEDVPGQERSLHFWHYNFGKRGISLDLETQDGRRQFKHLARTADVLLDTRPADYLAERGLGYEVLSTINPRLIMARISPFGDEGPWGDYTSSDLVHLALGGVMDNCGYDPDPSGFYDTPPIAPQMWQSFHIAGEMAAMGILAALNHRLVTNEGQHLSTSVHSAVAQATERDLPGWLFARHKHVRMTCRHSDPVLSPPVLAPTKDGRYLFPYRSYARIGSNEIQATIGLLAKYGMAEDLLDPKFQDSDYMSAEAFNLHVGDVVARFVQRFMFSRELWREAQSLGLTWAPIRRPEENAADEHWLSRRTFMTVERPELGRGFVEVGARWTCPQVPWRQGPRSPLLGEHNDEILKPESVAPAPSAPAPAAVSGSGQKASQKSYPLEGVKFIDLGWILASSGPGRFLAAMGAEVIKVEHRSRWDGLRWGKYRVPPGGRPEREAATGALADLPVTSPNRSGFFMDINAGKRAISLNLKHPGAKEILAKLVEGANILGEGFSPGTMDRMGFGYDRLKEINPSLVYVQQSGMGQIGKYGEMRCYGPVAQAISGISDMSGLPDPFPPAGIGYSFLDWCGAYNMANAMLAGLHRQKTTGLGCWIDASQAEVGTYYSGTATLDWSANGRHWSRYGNRSPYKLAAPHGAFRAAGEDRWVAISCFTEQDWRHLLMVLGNPGWGSEFKFATLEARLAHQDELEALVNAETAAFEPYALMGALQAVGVAAGVCQSASDRCDTDPQLKNAKWLVDLPQAEAGLWPCKDMPVRFSRSAVHIGGPLGRNGPNYAEDNEYIYGEWLGFSSEKIRQLETDGVI